MSPTNYRRVVFILVLFSLFCPTWSLAQVAASWVSESARPAHLSTTIDPCEDYTIEDVRIGQRKAGEFRGTRATYDSAQDIWHQDPIRGTTWACIKNPNTADLIDAFNSNPASISIRQNFGWHGRGRRSVGARVGHLHNVLHSRSTSSTACYWCAFTRHRGCFDPETSITTADGSAKKAKDVSVGDLLLNPVTNNSVKVFQVIEGSESLPLIELALNGQKLAVSQNHPVLTSDGIKRASQISLGDKVQGADGEFHTLSSLTILPEAQGQRVINFILGEDAPNREGEYVLADGIVTGDFSAQQVLVSSK